jgi:hypothetical protein
MSGADAYTLTWSGTLGGKPSASGEEKLHRVKN